MEAAFDQNDLRASVRFARRAASLTVPGTSHEDRAFWRLVVIAQRGRIVQRHLVTGVGLAVIGAACWTLAAYRA